MDEPTFIAAFDRAARSCRAFAERFVSEHLPMVLRFDFPVGARPVDGEGRVKFLGGRLLTPDQLHGVDGTRACRYLWVDGQIPVWINLNVASADERFTYVEVRVSHLLTADDRVLYHQWEGNPPFHVLSPCVPPGWKSLEESGKFSLGWRSDVQR